MDFIHDLEAAAPHLPAGKCLVYYPGSSIGNFPPDAATALLARFRRLAGADSQLLIGFDLRKDPLLLHAAYNDAAGVTAAFNLNLLERINRELDADLDPARFRHYAFYSAPLGRSLDRACKKLVTCSFLRSHGATLAWLSSRNTSSAKLLALLPLSPSRWMS